MVTHFKVKLIHRLKTRVGREVEKKCLSRETSVNSPTTRHDPSSGMSAPSAPHNPTATGARNKCSSSWYRRTSLDNATGLWAPNATKYQIGKAKQNAKEVWAHRKSLLGNLIVTSQEQCPYLETLTFEHCSHLLSYLFVHVFSVLVLFSYFCNSAWPLYWLYISETRQWLVCHFILLFGEGRGGDVTLPLPYILCISSCIRRFPDDSVLFVVRNKNTEHGIWPVYFLRRSCPA